MSKISSISGFLELQPAQQIAFNKALELIKHYFELSGFTPLDTPAVERVTTLLSKGGNDHEIYGIYRLSGEEGNNKKDLALRYDLTVPLARFVAQHHGNLTFPYRRYHIAPVWRGERAQDGRYRQFYQCDIDIVGEEELSLIYEAEIPSIIYQIFKEMKIGKFTIRINNRHILRGILTNFDISDEDQIRNILRVIDKIEKIDLVSLKELLVKEGLSIDNTEKLIEFITKKLSNDQWLDYLKQYPANDILTQGILELEQLVSYMRIFGVEDEYFVIDPTIARGLDYYTGTIYETKLDAYPELGSICSGGRYNNLAGNFTNRNFPGVGISIGLTRLIPKLIQHGIIKADIATTASIMVSTQNHQKIADYLRITKLLRDKDINTEIYLQAKNLATQMKYANKKGFHMVVIADEQELNNNQVILKNLITGEQELVSIDNLADKVIESKS